MRFVLFSILFVSTLSLAQPAAAFNVDLGFRNNGDITFSEEVLVTGQTVRIYARVRNLGAVDVSGYVYFMQGEQAVGNSQVISVRSGGTDEEVYVDFVVPESAFNVRVEIRGTDPADENPSNDVALSALYTPVQDADDDGVIDDEDDCPTTADAKQVDTDGDLIGDACDSDDDNDTLSDSVETEIGLNPLKADSDSDGVTDPNDYAPNDPTITGAPAPTPEPVATTEVTTVNPDTSTSADGTGSIASDTSNGSTADEAASGNGAALSDLQISPNAIFQYEQTTWNSYHFDVRGFTDGAYRYQWDFGDGVSSSRSEVDHAYRTFGDYQVTLTVTDANGQTATDTTEISVSFFNFENLYLKMLLAGLVILCLISLGLFVRTRV